MKAPCVVCAKPTTLSCTFCARALCALHAAWGRESGQHAGDLPCPRAVVEKYLGDGSRYVTSGRAQLVLGPVGATADELAAQMTAINAAIEQARRSYRESLSAMGAHGAPVCDVIEFALRWRMEQVVPAPPGSSGNITAPTYMELAQLVVDALVETGHIVRA